MAQVTEDMLRQQLADCHRMMVMAELLDYSGHVSARVPGANRALILPRDASRASVTADEMLWSTSTATSWMAKVLRPPKRRSI